MHSDYVSTPFGLPTPDEKFIQKLDKAIEFHRTNQNDPYGLAPAVMCALTEVREALAESRGLPLMKRDAR